MQYIETLLGRQYFAASPIDTTWHYDASTLTAAAGQHVTVQKVAPTSDGHYLMLAQTIKGAYVMARLQENGRLDTSYGKDGVVDVGIGASGGIEGFDFPYQDLTVTSDSLGYAYVINNFSVTRFRGNGTRDTYFGRRGVVSFKQPLLDVEPDNAGGFDAVETDLNSASDAATLVHVSEDGTQSVLWSGVFPGVGNATQNPFAIVQFAKIMHLGSGKLVVVTSRQFYGDASNDGEDNGYKTGGDADVYYLSPKGTVLGTNHFDTGTSVTRADSNSDADPVILYYGRRKLYIRSGHKFYRATLAQSETPNLPNGGLLTLHTDAIPHTGAATTYVTGTTLYNPSGSLNTSLDRTGSYSLIARINAYAAVVDRFAPRQNDVLVGAYVPERDHRGREIPGSDDLNLLRLWTTDDASATLVSAGVKKQTATVTIRYRAKGQVDSKTVGSGSLNLVTLGGTRIPMRLISLSGDADNTLIAQFRSTGLTPGTYTIETPTDGVLTTRGYGIAPAILGELSV